MTGIQIGADLDLGALPAGGFPFQTGHRTIRTPTNRSSGKPRFAPESTACCAAVLYAWYPGPAGGAAAATARTTSR